jgi:hypothetical protein
VDVRDRITIRIAGEWKHLERAAKAGRDLQKLPFGGSIPARAS